MSKNREHVIWESKDGSWNIGFFQFIQIGEDEEWDVEYIYSEFFWARSGMVNADAARRAWTGPNPGADYSVIAYADAPKDSDEYDEMVMALRSPEYALKRQKRKDEKQVRSHAKNAAEGVRMLPGLDVEVVLGTANLTTFLTGTLRVDGDWLVIRSQGKTQRIWHLVDKRAWTGKVKGTMWGVRSVRTPRFPSWR